MTRSMTPECNREKVLLSELDKTSTRIAELKQQKQQSRSLRQGDLTAKNPGRHQLKDIAYESVGPNNPDTFTSQHETLIQVKSIRELNTTQSVSSSGYGASGKSTSFRLRGETQPIETETVEGDSKKCLILPNRPLLQRRNSHEPLLRQQWSGSKTEIRETVLFVPRNRDSSQLWTWPRLAGHQKHSNPGDFADKNNYVSPRESLRDVEAKGGTARTSRRIPGHVDAQAWRSSSYQIKAVDSCAAPKQAQVTSGGSSVTKVAFATWSRTPFSGLWGACTKHVGEVLSHIKIILKVVAFVSIGPFNRILPILTTLVVVSLGTLMMLNLVSVGYAAATRNTLAIFCNLPIPPAFRDPYCAQFDRNVALSGIRDGSLAEGFGKTNEYFEQILFSSRYPKLLPHSMTAIQDAMRTVRVGVRRSKLTEEEKSDLDFVLSQYMDVNSDAISALQSFLSGTSNTVDWVHHQTAMLVRDLKALDSEDQSPQKGLLEISFNWLAERRIVWLPMGLEPFQSQHRLVSRGITRLRTHVSRIEPKVYVDIARAIALQEKFSRLSLLIEELYTLTTFQEIRMDEEKERIEQERIILTKFFVRLGYNMGDTDRVDQRIRTLQATRPITKDARSYLSGANLTLNNIKSKCEYIQQSLDEEEWLDENVVGYQSGFSILSTAIWIEKGAQRLAEAQSGWNEFQKDWSEHVFASLDT